MKTLSYHHRLWWLFVCLLLLTACGATPTEAPLPTPELVQLPTETISVAEPSPTVDPAVAIVNGEEIGKAIYRLRKCTVEPVIGIIKETLGFRQFSLRGMTAAAGEWCLVCLAFNLKRFHKLLVVC